MTHRKTHREICSLCHEVSRVGFWVPDEVWELATHRSYRNSIICLRCFTRLADERGVAWDKWIEFFPRIERITEDLRDVSQKIGLLARRPSLSAERRAALEALQRSLDGVRGWELGIARQLFGLDQDLLDLTKCIKTGKSRGKESP